MPVRLYFLAALSVTALVSCERPPNSTGPVTVVFVVESDPGVRLRGARVVVDGDPVGESDSSGLVRAKIHQEPGQRLTVQHQCPDGHEASPESTVLRLRRFEGFGGSQPPPIEVTLRCNPTERLAVFVVRAKKGANLPVLLDGEPVARTNGAGVAHFSRRGLAGTDLTVELETREHPHLRPQRPAQLFTLPDADEVFVFNQSFETRIEPGRRRRARPRITKIE